MRKPFRLGLAVITLLLLALSAFGTYTGIQAAVTKTPLPGRTPGTSATLVSTPGTNEIGTLLFSASTTDGKLNTYSVDTDGKNFKLLDGCTFKNDIRWSSDGKHLAYYNKDGKLTIADPDCSNPQSFTDTGKTDIEYYLAWTPDGKQLTYAALPALFNLDVTTGKTQKLFELDKAITDVSALRWSPDGKHLAFTAENGGGVDSVQEIHVVNADGTNDQVIPLVEKARPDELAISNSIILWSSDSQKIGYVEDGGKPGIYTYDIVTKVTKPVLSLTQKGFTEVETAEWSPDSTQVAFAKYDGKVEHLFVLPTSGGNPREIPLGDSLKSIYNIAWRPAVTNNAASATVVATAVTTPTAMGVSTSAATQAPTMGAGTAGGLQPITAANAAQVTQINTFSGSSDTSQVLKIAFSPDGKILASASEDTGIHLIDVTTGKVLMVLKGHTGPVFSVAYSPDGKTLASGAGHGVDTTVRLWDVATGKLLKTLPDNAQGADDFVVFSPDGKTLADGAGGSVQRWEATSGKALSPLKAGANFYAGSIAFSPDGKILAATSVDKSIQLWTVATGKPLTTLQSATNSEYINSVAFSPDGKTLAAGMDDKTVGLWDIGTSKLLTSFKGHTGSVVSVTFSPDGQVLASGSVDGTVRLWEVGTGKSLVTLQRQSNGGTAVFSVVFSPDGKLVALAGSSPAIELWGVAGS